MNMPNLSLLDFTGLPNLFKHANTEFSPSVCLEISRNIPYFFSFINVKQLIYLKKFRLPKDERLFVIFDTFIEIVNDEMTIDDDHDFVSHFLLFPPK